MPQSALSASIARVGRAVDDRKNDLTDGQLLTRFVSTRDDAAFAELVRRLGPMVLGVCRRVTGDTHLADDAFQAAFIVLARRAKDVRPVEAARSWLYGVAFRTARRAHGLAARRSARETLMQFLPDRAAEPDHSPDSEAIAVLDEELALLPEHLRAAVIFCELEGMSRKDAAARLNIPEGTLSSRLDAARKRLGAALKRRGMTLAAGLGALAAVAVPPTLLARTTASITDRALPPAVAALSNGALRMILLQKLKVVVVPVGLLSVVLATGWLAFAGSNPPPPPLTEAKSEVLAPGSPNPVPGANALAPAPATKGPNKLLIYRGGYLTLIDPDRQNEMKLSKDREPSVPVDFKLSPDGKRVGFVTVTIEEPNPVNEVPPKHKQTLLLRDVGSSLPGTDLGVSCVRFWWSGDGKEILYMDADERNGEYMTNIFTLATKATRGARRVPRGHLISDWSTDGKSLITAQVSVEGVKYMFRLSQVPIDGSGERALTPATISAPYGRLSPDGKQLLFSIVTAGPDNKPEQTKTELAILDMESLKMNRIIALPVGGDRLVGSLVNACWAPDSKRIAYIVRDIETKTAEGFELSSSLIVCDADGKNSKTLVTEKITHDPKIHMFLPDTIGILDWR